MRSLLVFLFLLSTHASASVDEFDFDIAVGPYEASRESIAKHYRIPEWFRDAKFGIYMHWGLNSVSGYDGHYARFMYHQVKPEGAKLDDADRAAGKQFRARSGWKPGRNRVYDYHVKKFGHPSKFGYKDFIPLFTAEKFDANELATFYKSIGARYIGVMAVHHDNFDLFDSTHQRWNSVNMGPKLDVVGAWRDACKQHNLRFAITNHMNDGHDHVFFQGETDAHGPLKGVPYDTLDPANDGLYGKRTDKNRWRIQQPGHSQHWYQRIKQCVDKYDPDLVFLDGGLNHGKYGLHFAAHYYNQNLARNGKQEGIITIKAGRSGEPRPGFVVDVESGAIDSLQPEPWQVDTTLNPGWFYLGEEYSREEAARAKTAGGESGEGDTKQSDAGADRVRLTAGNIVDNLVDTVSKNGTMMLNVGLRPNGSLPDTFRHELEEVGKWLSANGEAIYETRPWKTFGEGPTKPDINKGYNDATIQWTAADVRFTTHGETLYAIFLNWPGDGKEVVIGSLGLNEFRKPGQVYMLTTGQKLLWKQTREGLAITLPQRKTGKFAYVVKFTPSS